MPNITVAKAWSPRIARRSLRKPQDEPATTPARPKISASMALNSTDGGRVLSKQWQGEFCRCSIDVVGGKQCDGGVDHVERFRHNAGPSAKAGKPMTQTTVDLLNCHRFILADVVPPNRQERVVRPIIVRTVQRDAPGFQPLQQPVQRGGITIATFPVDEALARAIKSQPDPQLVLFLKEMPKLVQFHHNHALARIRLRARRLRCGMSADPIQN